MVSVATLALPSARKPLFRLSRAHWARLLTDTAGGAGCTAPPCAAGPQTKADYIANLLVLREAALAANIPFFNFFKAMPYGSGTTPSPYDVSESEMRWQAMTSLALGAKGVMYYCYWTPNGFASRLGQAIMTPAPGSKPDLANQVPGPKYLLRNIAISFLKGTSLTESSISMFSK